MTTENKWQFRFQNFEKAFRKLSDIAIIEQLNETEKMALIQAFEFTFELAWKTLKDYLTENGFVVASPKETIRQGYQSGYIKDGVLWMEAIKVRNESTHAYNDEILDSSTDFILNKFYPAIKCFNEDFKKKIEIT
ncbi:MAG: nucleotidyltransferase substrate binding protein like protein [Ignavibacteria bacterium]|nr:nucleotidyltransferase substrate binding protein like protein [Ignavibacteria bacterium]